MINKESHVGLNVTDYNTQIPKICVFVPYSKFTTEFLIETINFMIVGVKIINKDIIYSKIIPDLWRKSDRLYFTHLLSEFLKK